jgi:prepilin-type N-terminal cleavage/methylation domain-containing protein
MKTANHAMRSGGPSVRRLRRAMTLVELMITMTIFGFVTVGLMWLHLFGLKQDQLVQSKLGASDQSRGAFSKMTSEIRSAKILRVGNVSGTNFAPVPFGTNQQGTALQISFTTDTNSYVRYYFVTNASELRRIQTGVAGYDVVAQFLTNSVSFRAEDHLGNVLTDGTHSYTIRTVMQFYQYMYPLTRVGPGYLYDYYKLEFKATRRAHD